MSAQTAHPEGDYTGEAETVTSAIDTIPTNAHRTNCCDAWFTGSTASHCAGCHHTFTSPSGFTQHRRNGECLHPETLGMVAADRKWVGWQLPGTYAPEEDQ